MAPFEMLISTILSQSTTAVNERRGLNDLRSSVGAITPQRLADTPEGEIAKAIWHAGLATQKAPRIRGVARALLDDHGGRLEEILALPTERAREELMPFPASGRRPPTSSLRWPPAIRRSRSTRTSLASPGDGTSFGGRITGRSGRPSSDGPRRRRGKRGISPSSPTAGRCAKPGILGAASAPFGATAIGINASGPANNGRAAEFGVRRQRIKSAARLARERILDGVGLRLCAADETPDRCPPAARRGRRLHRDERGRGGCLAIRPLDARGPPGGRGRERDEPLLGPRPRLGHAPDPDPTVATTPD